MVERHLRRHARATAYSDDVVHYAFFLLHISIIYEGQ
jgi:hypothetical protein